MQAKQGWSGPLHSFSHCGSGRWTPTRWHWAAGSREAMEVNEMVGGGGAPSCAWWWWWWRWCGLLARVLPARPSSAGIPRPPRTPRPSAGAGAALGSHSHAAAERATDCGPPPARYINKPRSLHAPDLGRSRFLPLPLVPQKLCSISTRLPPSDSKQASPCFPSHCKRFPARPPLRAQSSPCLPRRPRAPLPPSPSRARRTPATRSVASRVLLGRASDC